MQRHHQETRMQTEISKKALFSFLVMFPLLRIRSRGNVDSNLGLKRGIMNAKRHHTNVHPGTHKTSETDPGGRRREHR
jgi:hypothetical protein